MGYAFYWLVVGFYILVLVKEFVWLLELMSIAFVSWFVLQDNKDLYAEEAAAQRERERQRMLSIPGLIAPNEIQDEMVDS